MSILQSKYEAVRGVTRLLTARLSAEDQMIQSCPEACPVKWHQAHTTWFFEIFVLLPFLPEYRPFSEEFHRLFHSYSISPGQTDPEKKRRLCFSRPSLEDVLAFRRHVDRAIERLLSHPINAEPWRRILLGLNHEQQHQELALSDIKHAFFSNPLYPAYEDGPFTAKEARGARLEWHAFEGGQIEMGHVANPDDPLDFCFDNETPRHPALLTPFQMANRKVTCREYLEFMADDAYMRPELWLFEGWETVNSAGWESPLYWDRDPGDRTGWRVFTLRGWRGLSALLDTPVCHVSFFEADSFARWRGCRLPTETEWEFVARREPRTGNLLDSETLHPEAATGGRVCQIFGDCWEWTSSPYTGYPGYRLHPGALGDCNGKFMSSQMVLRGGSCVTPADHVRPTSRKYYPPATRLQFTGIRMAI
jgi:ergothioneine biosynthesis protein EgtB